LRRDPRIQPRFLSACLALGLALGLTSCAKQAAPEKQPNIDDFDSLPPAELTERGARDSARVAQLAVAYFERVAARRRDKALELFFPESLLVGREDGSVETEGRSLEAAARVAADESTAARIRRVVLLRRATRDLLENTYREIWGLRYVPDRDDSSVVERRLHVIQQLGQDTRWLGKIEAGR
jgi:hypothetical protein